MKSKNKGIHLLLLVGLVAFLASCGALGKKSNVMDKEYHGDGSDLQRVKQELVAAQSAGIRTDFERAQTGGSNAGSSGKKD